MSSPSVLAVWVHTPHPFLVDFGEHFGIHVAIRYYGLAYLLSFIGGVLLLELYHRKGRSPFGANTIADLMTYLVAGVVLGGRVGYFLLYQPGKIFSDPLALFRVWEGGMSSHGGFLGVTLALWWWSRRRQVPMLLVGDLIVTTVPVGWLLGRLANFANGELWGKVTDVPWAFVFEQTGGGNLPRHPSQLYQAALEGVLLLAYMQWRFWKSNVTRDHVGRLSGEFLVIYSLMRCVGEMFREPDASLILGLSRGTFYSLFLIAAGVVLIARARRSEHVA